MRKNESKNDATERGITLWFTGLSGSGKSTLAQFLFPRLKEFGKRVEILDGDEVRENLSKGLGFSKEDRDTNIRRIGFVANLLARNGVVAITAAISPYREIRDEIRRKAQADFIEVFVRCSLDILEERDTKGLYKKARAGIIKNFTGVSDPYEEPDNPEIVVDSGSETIEESADKILKYLHQRGLISERAHAS